MTFFKQIFKIDPTAKFDGGGRGCAVVAEPVSQSSYDPIPSIWKGEDSELLELMLNFYPSAAPERVLDATVNSGRFWYNSNRPVVGLDIETRFRPEILGTSICLPFISDVFDVVVYDPPHIPNHGKDKQKDFTSRFGLGQKSSAETNYNFSHTYKPFVEEAYRVLKYDGILFCKITDYIHNHRFQWAHIDLINAATEAGYCACDFIIKARKGPIIDIRWKVAHHARKRHCYWLVFRKSSRCE